ncbi:hypothetical protein CI41S_12240 [Bradyrhizobium ivorense]|nr:hypothetical protein CI41S_12240 [Bradyrhizobium ivorense]
MRRALRHFANKRARFRALQDGSIFGRKAQLTSCNGITNTRTIAWRAF